MIAFTRIPTSQDFGIKPPGFRSLGQAKKLGIFGFDDFDFSMPDFTPPGPAIPPAAPPAPPPAAPPAVPPPPTLMPEEFQYIFPVGAAVLACPAGPGVYNLIDPVSGVLMARSAALPAGATVLAAGDPRCVDLLVIDGLEPAAASTPAVSTDTLIISGATILGIVAIIALAS